MLITGLDHVVVLTSDINAGSAAYQTLFARSPAWQNSGDGADRVLFTLDNMTLELMAPSGEGADGGSNSQRVGGARRGAGEPLLSHQRHRQNASPARPADAEAGAGCRGRKPRRHLAARRCRGSVPVRRRRPRAASGCSSSSATRNARCSVRTAPRSITAMDHVVVSTSDPERAAALYGARLGLDMALDRSHPDWGRLMFFRCGDLIVEVTHRPGKQADAGRDVARPAARPVLARRRHRRHPCAARAAGVDVSEVRTGRKPGTRVMTVRSGTCGVPTLLVQPSAKPA